MITDHLQIMSLSVDTVVHCLLLATFTYMWFGKAPAVQIYNPWKAISVSK